MSVLGKRFAACIGIAVVAVSVATAQSAFGGPSPKRHSRPAFHAITPRKVTDKYLDGLSSKPVQEMVEVAGDAVTVADAKSGRHLTKSEKNQIRADLTSLQGGVAAQVKALGGSV